MRKPRSMEACHPTDLSSRTGAERRRVRGWLRGLCCVVAVALALPVTAQGQQQAVAKRHRLIESVSHRVLRSSSAWVGAWVKSARHGNIALYQQLARQFGGRHFRF
jgi:hypothetical protein